MKLMEVNATLEGFSRIDFEKAKVRRAMRGIGREVQTTARRLVARRAVSLPGQFPGRDSGRLWRSIKFNVSRSGFMVRIAPEKTDDMGAFYPSFLFYGVPGRIAPRANYMTSALEERRDSVRNEIREALLEAVVPR